MSKWYLSGEKQFREGDVVQHSSGEEGVVGGTAKCLAGEIPIRWSTGWPDTWVDPIRYPGQEGSALADNCHLLRRPVEVGDELRLIRQPGFKTTACAWRIHNNVLDGYEHADGTPIEPQTSGAKPREGASATAPRTNASTFGESPRVVDPTMPARGPEEAGATICGVPKTSLLTTQAAVIDELRQKLAATADRLQPLSDERDALKRRCDALELQLRRAGLTPVGRDR